MQQPASKRQAIISQLTIEEKAALYYRWPFWAREAQLPPAGDWQVWLVRAGRGFGKTRCGAEWVRSGVESGRFGRIALVGPTAADARDVMVEGESGLMSICPPWNRPTYEPSKRRLTWPNGALAVLYSAEEPDRLRGPQHAAAWCLSGETMVLMGDGTEKELRTVRLGEQVMTRKGPCRVIGAALTKRNSEVFELQPLGGRSVIGTGSHRVCLSTGEFVPIDQIPKGASVCVINAWNGTAERGTCGEGAITRRISGFIARSGKQPMALFRRGMTFITSTTTRRTTGSRIWSCYQKASTALSTSRTRLDLTEPKGWRRHGRPMPGGGRSFVNACLSALSVGGSTQAGLWSPAAFARPDAFRGRARVRSRVSSVFASIAANPIKRRAAHSATAGAGVMTAPRRLDNRVWSLAASNVPIAAKRLKVNAPMLDSAAGYAPSLSMRPIVSVEKLAKRADVYDIAVEEIGEFFANGVLVHNCDELGSWSQPAAWDMLMFGLRLGERPQVVVTTTPKPTKLVKEVMGDPNTVETRGTSYENRLNLAPAFFDQIVRKYEGTRLGRQELLAELLDDNPYALWHRDAIDQARVAAAPALVRIVVAIDPAVTANEDSDETGIVCAGKTAAGQYYVLADRSMRGSPKQWASAAVGLYERYEADRLVAEVNNGGDMVRDTIRAVNRDASYKEVRATRGKLIRAEPIAALYEQGRVHHVGSFPMLEDQLCDWVPGDPSPDRLDALVWALSELSTGATWVPVALSGQARAA